MRECDSMPPEELAAWIDGEATPGAAAAVAAHVAGCPHCAARADRLRAQKERLTRYRAATTPGALPTGLWERTRAAMDAADAADRRKTSDVSRKGGPSVTPHVSRLTSPGRWSVAARLALAAVLVAAFSLVHLLMPRPVAPLAELAARPIPARATFATADADRAARWLGRELGAAFPPVNLSLVGARLVGATALPERRHGVLIYQGDGGTAIALHVYLVSRMTLPKLSPVRYDGSPYGIRAGSARQATLVAWQYHGRTFVAAARLSPEKLLPYAREMDRHCRRRQ